MLLLSDHCTIVIIVAATLIIAKYINSPSSYHFSFFFLSTVFRDVFCLIALMNFHKYTTLSGEFTALDKSVYFIAFDYCSFVVHVSKGIVGVVQMERSSCSYMIKMVQQGRTQPCTINNSLVKLPYRETSK